MTELDAELQLCDLFAASGAAVRRQVKLGGKRLDVAVRFTEGALGWAAVEVKLHDWKRAVRQAGINRAFFGSSFIAVPDTFASGIDRDYLARRGVGLIRFSDDAWRIEVEPAIRLMPEVVEASLEELLA